MKKSKPLKRVKEAHTADTKYGMGDYYGSGIRNPVGRVVEGIGKTIPKAKIGIPPKKLA